MDIIIEGFQVTVIGMGVVFLILLMLILILQLFETLFYKGKDIKGTKYTEANKINKVKENEGLDEVVAAVSTVMSEVLDENEYIINVKQLN